MKHNVLYHHIVPSYLIIAHGKSDCDGVPDKLSEIEKNVGTFYATLLLDTYELHVCTLVDSANDVICLVKSENLINPPFYQASYSCHSYMHMYTRMYMYI